ncbi:class C sortase [uncultured Ezakiella sp.]|uniref:class C sortase n=1 Tax=uncultured Ezakiella sp. TaxID=1637529 RepID=UPI0025F67DA6|nr:class C sortase [uncultured Ezakiella sp.]
MKRNNKKRGKFYIIIGLVFILAGMSVIGYQKLRLSNRNKAAKDLEGKMRARAIVNKKPEVLYFNEDDIKEVEIVEAPEEDLLEKEDALAVIRIDKLDILLPIYPSTREKYLRDGVGIIETTDKPVSEAGTTCALAGHRGGYNEDDSFLHIDKLEEGDEIKITSAEEVLTYKVYEKEIIKPDDWSKFNREEEKTKLVLMTCHPYPYDYERLLVKAYLVDKE